MATTKKKAEAPQVSTVKIDKSTGEKLDVYCKRNELTKKDFISLALDYFERTGVDIRSNDVPQDLTEIKESINSLVKLQADAAIKLTSIQQTTHVLQSEQETTKLLLEANTQKKRSWFGFGKK